MLEILQSRRFKRDYKKMIKRGCKPEKLEAVLALLITEESLPERFRAHKLSGDYAGFWECHIEPDWLLVYRYGDGVLDLARTGTHSDLFS